MAQKNFKPGLKTLDRNAAEAILNEVDAFAVVMVDALLKNPSGKVLKRQLRDEHATLAEAIA